MSLKAYLWGLKISAFLALSALSLVVIFVNPEKGGLAGQLLFYFSLFLTLAGIFILMFTLARKKVVNEEERLFNVGMSFRQGFLLALLAIILLVMQHFKVLIWWDGLLAVAGIFLTELYFLSR